MLEAAFDNGNSTIKMIIDTKEGSTSKQQKSVVSQILTVKKSSETDLKEAIANIFDNMVVHIASKAIKRVGLYAVGEKAYSTGNRVRNMNIKVGEKHNDDIPVITSLAMIAATAIQNSFNISGDLPSELDIELNYSTAIPAREYSADIAKELEKRFMDGPHIVNFYVNNNIVVVRINIEKCKVTKEGTPAVFAIIEGDKELLEDFNNRYEINWKNKDFAEKKLLLVDIGDGTTELIYVVNGKPKADLSTGFRAGVGHAASSAKDLFDEYTKVKINMNRQQFMSVVLDEKHHYHAEADEAMKQANYIQSQEIFEQIEESFLDRLQGDVDVIVVFGGGAAEFRESLFNDVAGFVDSVGSKVLWIPDEKAPTLNVDGLDILNKKVFFKK
ncbi:hypothetical protein [Viridibacillus arvi]|uniref:hypothetical protein n=1 Tax=Viridibacillus arvi TaxID=263475 RepID=UPI0034CEFE8F